MAIDVGEGLRGIQPVVGVLKADAGYRQSDPNAPQFRDSLQECLKERKQPKGADVLRKVKYSYDKLYCDYGVQPNAVMITQDYLAAVIAECRLEYLAVDLKPDQLLGMDVIPIIGKETVKACIINKEE